MISPRGFYRIRKQNETRVTLHSETEGTNKNYREV